MAGDLGTDLMNQIRDVLRTADDRREQTQQALEDFLQKRQDNFEKVFNRLRDELDRQWKVVSSRLDDLEGEVQEVLERVRPGGTKPAKKAATAAKKAPATKTAAKKTAAKKAPAKKAASTRKTTTAKATAAKASAKKNA